MASYSVNPAAVAHAERLIDARQYALDSEWGAVQPRASEENAFPESRHYRPAEWRHKEIELAAHELLQRLDAMSM